MAEKKKKEYRINIDPRILELLGPNLYTNIYYVLAELIANAYDANADNVYIIQEEDKLIVEDDGIGMSYEEGDINKYLAVAVETRTTEDDVYTKDNRRKRIGRKGIGKLSALSVSENVYVMTVKDGEKSGFILSRHVDSDHLLQPIDESDISFRHIEENGTSIIMTNPEYGLHRTAKAIKRNLLKIFPYLESDFTIHIKTQTEDITIEQFDKEMIEDLGAVILMGEEFHNLANYFDCQIEGVSNEQKKKLLIKRDEKKFPLKLKTRGGEEKEYELRINGWIGAYRTTKGRKSDNTDFPDNFISLLANGKLGEYNILPIAGKNKLIEVYIVGQLHVDLLEETELPDIALSNRQGYKSDDERYRTVINYVRDDLIPEIINLRNAYVDLREQQKKKEQQEKEKKDEEELRNRVDKYTNVATDKVVKGIETAIKDKLPTEVVQMIHDELNEAKPLMGIKRKVDTQKKKVLICHSSGDKVLADVICKMLIYNNVPDVDIIYTSSENENCRSPEGSDLFEYLKDFFVESYSTEKIWVIYVTSDEMSKSWYAVTEVGAGWITKIDHKIFNIPGDVGHQPQQPLNINQTWHNSEIIKGEVAMNETEFDKFIVKIRDVCEKIGYTPKSKEDNEKELKRYVEVID
ncbi:MAG: ATP-binding protein [Candidatus Altiarchaeales archaeon]|nr:ATP-binding protein [Candidatus Altiarchaeales archaeon]MBD3416796.1 ATP-binding protein [Candidatus Altiarchaeales archaeon]